MTKSTDNWKKEFNKIWKHTITDYLYSDEAFDLDLRESVAKTEIELFISSELTRQAEDLEIEHQKELVRTVKEELTRQREEMIGNLARAVGLLQGLGYPDKYLEKKYDDILKSLEGS